MLEFAGAALVLIGLSQKVSETAGYVLIGIGALLLIVARIADAMEARK